MTMRPASIDPKYSFGLVWCWTAVTIFVLILAGGLNSGSGDIVGWGLFAVLGGAAFGVPIAAITTAALAFKNG